MLQQIKTKLHSGAGFSLAETFLAVLILVMVSSVVASGIPVAASAYHKIVDAANAQVLLSTTATVLRDELGTAKDVTPSGASLTYTTGAGGRVTLYLSENGLCKKAGKADAPADDSVLLVSKAAANKNLHTTYDSVRYADGLVTFTYLRVLKDSDGTELASVRELKIRVLTAVG